MRLFGVVDRLVFREVLTPTVLGFITYTFLVVMRGLYTLIEQILVRGVSIPDAGRVLLLSLPHVVVLTIPMSFLFGVLLAVGRMNSDNEMVALQAGGIPLMRLLRPIVLFGILLSGLSAYLFLVVIPPSGTELRALRFKLFAEAKNLGRIEPGVFHEELPNILLYLRDIDADTGSWRDIMFFDSSNPGEERLTLARRGRVVMADNSEEFEGEHPVVGPEETEQWIRLEDVVTHQFSREKPETYRVNRNTSQLFRPVMNSGGQVRLSLGMRERPTMDLVRFVRGGELETGADAPTTLGADTTDEDRKLAVIEIHKRLAIPLACLVFAFLALPLGVGSRSSARGRGFVISVGVVLVYYLVSNQGEMLAISGKVTPWIGIWLPNIILTIAATFMMRKMGRWTGERSGGDSLLVRTVKRWRTWQSERHRRVDSHGRAAASPLTGSIPIHIQRRRYASRFPALFDRYVTNRLLPPLFLVLGSTALLYIVIDLSDRVEDMAKNRVPAEIIFSYYANLVPQVFLDVTPFALMIAVLILLTMLERQQELTALKAAGISLYRLTVPVLLIASAAAAGLWVLGEMVVPDANREAQRLRDRIMGRETTRSYRSNDRQWLMSRDDESLYNFLRYDDSRQALIRFTQFRIDENMALRYHLFTRRARFIDGKWFASSGWYREFFADGTDQYKRITSPVELTISEGPEYFGQEYRSPAEMSLGELGDYIDELVDSGYRPNRLIVRWHQKLTYPLSAFIMVLLALPFGLSRGGRLVSTMQGVATALILGIAYSMLVVAFARLGDVDILPPIISAWAPVMLAFFFAINRLTTLRT